MRATNLFLILIVGAVAGFVLSTVRPAQTSAAAVQTIDQVGSLIGQNVEVNFRKADDISLPGKADGQPHLAMKLTAIKGVVLSATTAWIELKTEDDGTFTHAWVPVSSIAYLNNIESPKAVPAIER